MGIRSGGSLVARLPIRFEPSGVARSGGSGGSSSGGSDLSTLVGVAGAIAIPFAASGGSSPGIPISAVRILKTHSALARAITTLARSASS